MLPDNEEKKGGPPHEAISVAGGTYFEVVYNHVYDCCKEGIEGKEVSTTGGKHIMAKDIYDAVYGCLIGGAIGYSRSSGWNY